jgi:magnesium chelatase family protein
MRIARSATAIVMGVDAHIIEVEAHLADGLVGMSITGLADTAVNEARDRVRAAIVCTGFPWPQRRITVGLSPAWLPKFGSGLDLAIALAVLAADERFDPVALERTIVIGELRLDGRVSAARGTLPIAMAAARWGYRRILVPRANAEEARLVPGLEVIPVGSLGHALRRIGVECEVGEEGDDVPVSEIATGPMKDLADVRGQRAAKFALEVAAAGGHHIALLGPPGVGKTLLAERLPTILPPLDVEAALEVTAVRSVLNEGTAGLASTPPFAAPHHGASAAAVIGGGRANPRVGLITAAHRGVLFLDEAPEFQGTVLEALRQPLESGSIAIARSEFAIVLPARFQLVIAANPCPCGQAFDRRGRCTCTPMQRRKYLSKLSGPLMDRIDVRVIVETPPAHDVVLGTALATESSAQVAERVARARERQRERFAGTPWKLNAEVPGPVLRRDWPLPSTVTARFNATICEQDQPSARGVDRMLRLAWTCADLAGRAAPDEQDLAIAMRLRDAGGRWAA